MYDHAMRTTVTLQDDTHEFATYYARARGLTLNAAIDELIRKAQAARHEPEQEIRRAPDGFPLLPRSGKVITSEMVKRLEEEDFDPRKFA